MLPATALTDLIPHLEGFLRDWIDQQRRQSGSPGIQVAIRLGERLLFSYASGVASTATGEPLSTAHTFRIASHSKTFTATAIMQQVEAGRLRLDDTLAQWVPALADTVVGAATVRAALGHQSGTERDGRDANFWQLQRPFPDEAELIATLREGDRVFGANTHFHYSNLAYSALGLVLEAVTERSYHDLMTELIAPLREKFAEPVLLGPELGVGTTDRVASGHGIPMAERADHGESVPPVIAPVDTRAQAAATGFWGNAESVSAWIAAHAWGTDLLLSDDCKRLMQRDESTITVAGATRRYGLGFIVQDVAGWRLIGHSGGFPGHITQTLGDPKTGLTVSALTNRIDGPAATIVTGIFGLLARVLTEVSDASAAVVLPEAAGHYLSLWGQEDLITLPGVMLRCSDADADPGARAVVLRLGADGALRADAGDGFADAGEESVLTRDASGAVTAITTTGITSWRPAEYARRFG